MAQAIHSKTTRPTTARTYVALLRGINVAGRNKLSKQDLAALFTEVGCANVRTYIQSGNVVFSAAPKVAKRLSPLIAQRIANRFGHRVPVVLRTAHELDQVAQSNPFLKTRARTDGLHVAFLADQPNPRNVAALHRKRSPLDSFMVRGREIFLHLPNGVARTKLTNDYFDSTLATTSTLRNWSTVLKLCELAKTGG